VIRIDQYTQKTNTCTAIRSDKISVLFLAQPITRTCVYIKVPYFTSFRFPASLIVGLGLGLVVGLGTMLV